MYVYMYAFRPACPPVCIVCMPACAWQCMHEWHVCHVVYACMYQGMCVYIQCGMHIYRCVWFVWPAGVVCIVWMCAYACIHVCMAVCVRTYMHACMHVSMWICMYVCMYV